MLFVLSLLFFYRCTELQFPKLVGVSDELSGGLSHLITNHHPLVHHSTSLSLILMHVVDVTTRKNNCHPNIRPLSRHAQHSPIIFPFLQREWLGHVNLLHVLRGNGTLQWCVVGGLRIFLSLCGLSSKIVGKRNREQEKGQVVRNQRMFLLQQRATATITTSSMIQKNFLSTQSNDSSMIHLSLSLLSETPNETTHRQK